MNTTLKSDATDVTDAEGIIHEPLVSDDQTE